MNTKKQSATAEETAIEQNETEEPVMKQSKTEESATEEPAIAKTVIEESVIEKKGKVVLKVSSRKQFFITLFAFLILGISFKVMVLVEGLTEVRPVNAIPPVAGLVCGPIGALACAIGNLLADMAGTFSSSSILGMVGNFIAAYLPYRLWHLFSNEPPSLHSYKHIVLYGLISLITAQTVAWILSFGLYVFWDSWIKEIYCYVFWNNFGFSVGLGMPIMIILTSDSIAIDCRQKPRCLKIMNQKAVRNTVVAGYAAFQLILMIGVLIGNLSPKDTGWLLFVSFAAWIGLIVQLL